MNDRAALEAALGGPAHPGLAPQRLRAAQKLNAVLRAIEAWKLELQGHTEREIAAQLGISLAQTQRDLADAKRRHWEHIEQERAEHLRLIRQHEIHYGRFRMPDQLAVGADNPFDWLELTEPVDEDDFDYDPRPVWATTQDVVDEYKISRHTLHRMEQKGDLHPIRFGRAVRWNLTEIEHAARQAPPGNQPHQR